VVEEGEIEGCADGIFQSLSKDSVASIVAIMKSIEDVLGIISHTIIVTLHIADPVPWRRRWRRLGRMMRMVRN
jgi:hypothetical protein